MRGRITVLVAAVASAVAVSFVIPLCLLVLSFAHSRAMASADHEARNAALLVTSGADRSRLREVISTAETRSGARVTVVAEDGSSEGSPPPLGVSEDELARARTGQAFAIVDGAGGRVYVPVVTERGTVVVRSVISATRLRAGVGTAWLGIIGAGAALTVVAVLAAARLSRHISEPLRAVSDVAHQLREGDLTARAELTGTEETDELAKALNGLAERIESLLVTEREAVGDLAHRLRTPVTALRLEAETVQDAELAHRLDGHIDQIGRAIDAIVREARRPVRVDLEPGCDARPVVAERILFWTALAEDQNRPVKVDLVDAKVPVPLGALDVRDIVDVLIDNVFAHTDEGVGFEVSLQRVDSMAVLRVRDGGPGFGAASAQGPGYTGLGLDIVRRTVSRAGGQVRTSAPGQVGAEVLLSVPLLG